jgi:ATP-dependent DNA helicase PIF1
VPLRLTVRGAAGTGKSFIIKTIVSYMRRMFDDNDVVHVVAPTGMAAFNVLGKTLHRFAGLDWRNMKKGMTNTTMEKLQKKLQNTVAIMMDERSMLSQIILGLVKQAVARSAHECGHSGEDWGGIPVMI